MNCLEFDPVKKESFTQTLKNSFSCDTCVKMCYTVENALNTGDSMEKNTPRNGTLPVILAGCCWGIISIFVRRLNSLGFDSLQIMFLRSWLSVLMLGGYLGIKDRTQLRIRLRDLWIFVGTGIVSLTFFSWCYFSSITLSGAAVAVVLLYTSPIFVMLMSAAVFREKFTARKLAALVLTFGGCVLVAGLAGSRLRLTPYAIALGLGSGIGYALYSVFGGIAVRRNYSSLTVTFYTLLLSGMVLPVLLPMRETAALLAGTIGQGFPYMLGIAFVCTVIPYLSYTYGLSRMEAGRAAVLVTVEPLVGTLLGILVWKEPVDLWKATGIGMIFVAVVLLSLPHGNEKQPQ